MSGRETSWKGNVLVGKYLGRDKHLADLINIESFQIIYAIFTHADGGPRSPSVQA